MKFENEPQTPSPRTINLRDGYLEEDLFPKLFTNYEYTYYEDPGRMQVYKEWPQRPFRLPPPDSNESVPVIPGAAAQKE